VLLLLRRLGGAGLPVHQRSLAGPAPAAAGEALTPALQELHDLVFRQPRSGSRHPLAALAGVSQLLVLPGIPLQDVPIAAAHDGTSFLIERRGVAFVPSGTWFALRRAQPEPRPLKNALVLADPTRDLPGARREGELVASLLRQAGIEVTLREGDQVTRRGFLEAGRDFDLVHYAGHGSFDLDRSSFLGVADGPLLLADLLTGPWRPRLVVLNACRSGVRKVHLLDETLSMASGFLAAGVGAVVSTLWPVGDDVALRFAGTLYADLVRGRAIGDAYQASLVRLIRSHVPAHEWAQYFLVGDPGVRV
jgi:CHAT domain-containing protein